MARLVHRLLISTVFGLTACEAAEPCPPPHAISGDPFMVFFPYGSVELSPQARSTVRSAASVAQGARVALTGHTDSAGDTQANLVLSRRRAEAVARALVEAGVAPTQIVIYARGSEQLMVQTGHGVREPQNRRVEFLIAGPTDAPRVGREAQPRCAASE